MLYELPECYFYNHFQQKYQRKCTKVLKKTKDSFTVWSFNFVIYSFLKIKKQHTCLSLSITSKGIGSGLSGYVNDFFENRCRKMLACVYKKYLRLVWWHAWRPNWHLIEGSWCIEPPLLMRIGPLLQEDRKPLRFSERTKNRWLTLENFLLGHHVFNASLKHKIGVFNSFFETAHAENLALKHRRALSFVTNLGCFQMHFFSHRKSVLSNEAFIKHAFSIFLYTLVDRVQSIDIRVVNFNPMTVGREISWEGANETILLPFQRRMTIWWK